MGTAAARSWNWRISANCQHPCRISRFVREYSLGTLVQFTVEGAASLAHPHQQTKFCCTYVLARYLRALLSCLSRNSKTQGGRGQDRARNTGREVGEIARACARSAPMRSVSRGQEKLLENAGRERKERREGEERTQRLRMSANCADGGRATRGVFGLWRVRFPPVLVRTGRRLPVQALCERRVVVALTGYPRGGAPGPG